MAFDLDGTLATEGRVSPELEAALEQCRSLGYTLFLVTGRRFESVALGRLGELFAGVVWENGAVLAHAASGELYLPFGQLNASLVKALEEAGVPLERGLAIVSTWTPHAEAVWRVLSSHPHGGGASVEYNKGAVMILPAGAAKGAGLDRLLTLCGFSARNVAAFGDAENDLSMLNLAEVSVAVGDAVPAVREIADVVAVDPGPAGALEVLRQYPLAGRFLDISLHRERNIVLGQDESGHDVTIPASRLAGRNLGVFGGSATGKSWMVGLLAEGLHRNEYQVLLIDPDGDFRSLRVLPRFVALDGDQSSMPSPSSVVALLDAGGVSVVLDLTRYPLTLRGKYVAEVLRMVQPLRARKYRPHWIVLEEAQQFLLPGGSEVAGTILPMAKEGGWCFVSYRPDRIDPLILQSLHHCLLTRLKEPEGIRMIQEHCKDCGTVGGAVSDLPAGSVLLCGGKVLRLHPAIRRVPHIRHLYKYMDEPLPPHKRFWFRDSRTGIGREAASLYEFLQLIPTLPIESLEYHDRRQDFARWVNGALGDADLAARLQKISNRQLHDDELREALHQTVMARYQEMNALR
jgi:hydroxymethylpyrimidine pyrophosphatase-like HAD family hydrolase